MWEKGPWASWSCRYHTPFHTHPKIHSNSSECILYFKDVTQISCEYEISEGIVWNPYVGFIILVAVCAAIVVTVNWQYLQRHLWKFPSFYKFFIQVRDLPIWENQWSWISNVVYAHAIDRRESAATDPFWPQFYYKYDPQIQFLLLRETEEFAFKDEWYDHCEAKNLGAHWVNQQLLYERGYDGEFSRYNLFEFRDKSGLRFSSMSSFAAQQILRGWEYYVFAGHWLPLGH